MKTFSPIVYATMDDAFSPSAAVTSEVQANVAQNRVTQLHCTVTTPDDAKPGDDLPVVVFVHGGSYVFGSRTEGWFNGEGFARSGVVLVTVDYRLGIQGFLPFGDEAPEHYRGVDDCHEALRWVQQHIESFGGDPTNVTLMGQSAGGGIVLWLSRSDHYDGMFRRVWAMSPGLAQEHISNHAAALRTCLGKPLTRKHLREASPRTLERGLKRFARLRFTAVPFGPGPLDPRDLAPVDMVLTSTTAEFHHNKISTRIDAAKLSKFPGIRGLITKAYGASDKYVQHIDKTSGNLATEIVGDALIRNVVATAALSKHPNVWVAEYAGERAYHCVDIPLVFDSVDSVDEGKDEVLADPPEVLVATAHNLVVDFAHGRTPNWPRYTENREALSINLSDGSTTLRKDTLAHIEGQFRKD